MTTYEAKNIAIALMEQHGLLAKGWKFQFNNRKRALGVCKWPAVGGGIIELSHHFVRLNDAEAVRQTVLHEIAHAIAGPEAGHGPAWKMACRHVGCKPRRCSSTRDGVTMPKGKYKLVCGTCNTEMRTYHRRPTRDLAQCYHPACGIKSVGTLRVHRNA